MSYMPVVQGQVLSTDNTKTVTSSDASPGSPWVGDWEQTRSLKFVRQLVVLAATDSTIGGTFTFEYSEDGITATISEERDIDDFVTVRDFDLLNAGEYFRVKFEPALALGTESVFVTTTQRPAFDGQFVRLGNQEIEEQNAALPSNFAYLKAFRNNGKSVGITATRGGALVTANIGTEIARGNVEGVTPVYIEGRNPDVDTGSTPEDVWLAGLAYTGQPTGSPETVSVESTSLLDTNTAGTGARTIRIHGLATSSSTEYTTEDIALNGITPVTSSGTWYRVNLVEVLTAGLLGTNQGIITVEHSTTAVNVFATVVEETGKSKIAAYTVPQSNTLFISDISINFARASGAAGSAEVTLQCREFGSGAWVDLQTFDLTDQLASHYSVPLEVNAQADIRFRVKDVSDNNTIIGVQCRGLLLAD